jgi:hypothetical protein
MTAAKKANIADGDDLCSNGKSHEINECTDQEKENRLRGWAEYLAILPFVLAFMEVRKLGIPMPWVLIAAFVLSITVLRIVYSLWRGLTADDVYRYQIVFFMLLCVWVGSDNSFTYWEQLSFMQKFLHFVAAAFVFLAGSWIILRRLGVR